MFYNEKCLNIKYDHIYEGFDNSFFVRCGDNYEMFPKSFCVIDTKSKLIYAPEWIIKEKGLENYIDGGQ